MRINKKTIERLWMDDLEINRIAIFDLIKIYSLVQLLLSII
jgi:hypothetical protein